MKRGTLFILVLALSAAAAGQTPPILKPRPFFVPKLVITDVKVKQDGWFFILTFAYRNIGTGSVPKASALAAKPDFRILIDGREINKGFLYIPETAAGPGWENPDFLAGRVRLPSPGAFDYGFFLGNSVTVKINENLAVGPTSDSQTYNLRQMALNCSYDAMINDASLDFDKGKLTITVRVDGTTGSVKKFQLWQHGIGSDIIGWHDIIPGQQFYTITMNMNFIRPHDVTEHRVDLYLVPEHSDKTPDVRDIDHRNNNYNRLFHR